MVKLWIARDKFNYLTLFKHRPIRDDEGGWHSSLAMHSQHLGIGMTDKIGDLFDEGLLPELTWDNSPMEIEIKLIKSDQTCIELLDKMHGQADEIIKRLNDTGLTYTGNTNLRES